MAPSLKSKKQAEFGHKLNIATSRERREEAEAGASSHRIPLHPFSLPLHRIGDCTIVLLHYLIPSYSCASTFGLEGDREGDTT